MFELAERLLGEGGAERERERARGAHSLQSVCGSDVKFINTTAQFTDERLI